MLSAPSPSSGVSADPAAPSVIAGRYELRDRIGAGAFGEVYEAYDQRLRRLVALKTLPIAAVTEAEAAEEFRRFNLEARAVARLSHPGIVTVHDFGETPEFAWIVMELVIGETLKAVLDAGERPSLRETGRVVGELLDALSYAHGRGIVHRDVKPANILLSISAAEGLGEVRLADFGVARVGEAQQTLVGQMVGTPVVMSPEQVRGEEVDQRSDLWSVGVILYQMLTGERPFTGTMPAIFQNILTRTPRPPSELVEGLPPALDAVVAKALAKSRADRYADAAAMAAALREAIAGPLIKADAEADTVTMAVPVFAALEAPMIAPLSAQPAPQPAPLVTPFADLPFADPSETLERSMSQAPMVAPAVAAPPRGRARRALLMMGIFAGGVVCGLAWPRIEAMDLPAAIRAGAQAFNAKLEETRAAEADADSTGSAQVVPQAPLAVPALTPAPAAAHPPLTQTAPLLVPATAPAPAAAAVPVPAEAPERHSEPGGAAMPPAQVDVAEPAPNPAPQPAVTTGAAPAPEAVAAEAVPQPVPAPDLGPIAVAPPGPVRESEPPPVLGSWLPAALAGPALHPMTIQVPVLPPALPPASPPPPDATSALPAPSSLPAAEANGRCPRDRLTTRSGSHPGFGRLVFDWTRPVRHQMEAQPQGALLRFPEAGCLPGVERVALPRNFRAIGPDETGQALRIETEPGARLRIYRLDGNRVVMDALDGAP